MNPNAPIPHDIPLPMPAPEPVLVGVLATTRLLGGRPISEIAGLVQILVLYDVVFVTLGFMLFPATMDE